MEIKETAMVGTLESGDVAITLDPNPGRGIEIELESDVKPQFGTAIERAGHMDNFATLYTNRLLASGFDYFGDFTNDDGSPVLIFTNGTYSVMMGASLISGIAGVMIVVTPE